MEHGAALRFPMRVMQHCATKFLLALVLSASVAGAQEAAHRAARRRRPPRPAAPTAPDTANILLAPSPKAYTPPAHVDSDGVARTISPGLAAALSDSMPRYAKPSPTPTPLPENTDMQDIDHPKNEIKRLPSYVVRETRPPVFRARDLYTSDELINMSFKAHAGLNFGNILGLNSGAAYQMYLEDQRKENMDDMTDLAHAMSRGGDAATGSYILSAERPDLHARGRNVGLVRRGCRGRQQCGGAALSDRIPDPSRAACSRSRLGFRGRDGRQARRKPGVRVAPDGEAPLAGVRVRGPASARPTAPLADAGAAPHAALLRPS